MLCLSSKNQDSPLDEPMELAGDTFLHALHRTINTCAYAISEIKKCLAIARLQQGPFIASQYDCSTDNSYLTVKMMPAWLCLGVTEKEKSV